MLAIKQEYEEVVQVPFEKLPKEKVKQLNAPRMRQLLYKILFVQISQLDSSIFKYLLHAVKQSRRFQVEGRSIAYCNVPERNEVAESYFSVRRDIENLTRMKLNDRVNAAIVAYWLHEHKKRDLNQYIKDGVLSEIASSDILELVERLRGDDKTQQLLSSRKLEEAGSNMISDKLKSASMRAFGVAPTTRVKLSDSQLSRHEERMKQYEAERASRVSTGMTMEEALQRIEESVLPK